MSINKLRPHNANSPPGKLYISSICKDLLDKLKPQEKKSQLPIKMEFSHKTLLHENLHVIEVVHKYFFRELKSAILRDSGLNYMHKWILKNVRRKRKAIIFKERYLLLKQQTFRVRMGPLQAKEKHVLYISFPLLTAWPINTATTVKKKKKLSRNMNLWHVLVKGSFIENL